MSYMDAGPEGTQEVIHDGHNIIFSETLSYFGHRLPLSFDRSFTFDCSVSPTSWSFRVEFQREEDGISCYLTIDRKDDLEINVGIVFMMKAFPITHDIDIPFKTVRMPCIPAKCRFEETFDGFLTDEVLNQIFVGHLQFQVFFIIHGCHGVKESLETDGDPPVVDGSVVQMLSSGL